MIKPVLEHWVIESPVWSQSTYACIENSRPLGLGAFGGISSFASVYGIYDYIHILGINPHQYQGQQHQKPSPHYVSALYKQKY